MKPGAKLCGGCVRFKHGTGLQWQYCVVRKAEVSARCKACPNFKEK